MYEKLPDLLPMAMMLISSVWKEQCARNFEGKTRYAEEVVVAAAGLLEEFLKVTAVDTGQSMLPASRLGKKGAAACW